MRIDVVTLFPEFLQSIAGLGVIGRAMADGRVQLHAWNPRDFAQDRHHSVDDRPYGGGPGMVMTVEPARSAIQAARSADHRPVKTSLMSPQGEPLSQSVICELASRERLLLVCGRYEGIDERLITLEVDEELSIGDYVISGGELAAAVTIDAVTRLLPGTLGDEQSAEQDSFMSGLLDHPHFSRPEVVDGLQVPPVLLSGDHAEIARWRRQQALGRTWQRRPELLQALGLTEEDRVLLKEYQQKLETEQNQSGADREREGKGNEQDH